MRKGLCPFPYSTPLQIEKYAKLNSKTKLKSIPYSAGNISILHPLAFFHIPHFTPSQQYGLLNIR